MESKYVTNHPVVFDSIDKNIVRAGGAYNWRRLCTDLIYVAKTTYVDPLPACRLDKNPGVRPIGIGDTAIIIIVLMRRRCWHHTTLCWPAVLQYCNTVG